MTTSTFANGVLGRAYKSLDIAASAKTPSAIYMNAFLAASQGAAAIISAKISPERAAKMHRPNTLWEGLIVADPELKDWAQYFAMKARRRDAAEKNLPNAVYRDQAEELLADTTQFLVLAEGIVQASEE